jgi:high-affinity Fe2+/Pb2+ permease
MTSATLTVTGLILDMIGAALLAYELFLGYPRRNRLAIAEAQWQQLQRFFSDVDRMIDAYKEPPYTRTEKEAEKKKVRADYQTEVDKLEADIRDYGESHHTKSFFVGIIGFGLLAIGFVLQLLGSLK